MPKFAKFAARTCSALVAMGIAVLTGATSAVVIVEGRLSALPNMISRAGWIMRGRPMAPGQADGGWLLEAEWRIAFSAALSVAFVSSVVWGILSWRKLQNHRTAAIIGFVVSTAAAGLLLGQEETSAAITHSVLIGLVGGAMGYLVHATDRALTGYLIPNG